MLSITYMSSATRMFTDVELGQMLEQSRMRNQADGITGVILYRDGNIIQVLEGAESAVRATMKRIGADDRHRGVLVVLENEIAERAFDAWSMGFRRVVGDRLEPSGDGQDGEELSEADVRHRRQVHTLLEVFLRSVR